MSRPNGQGDVSKSAGDVFVSHNDGRKEAGLTYCRRLITPLVPQNLLLLALINRQMINQINWSTQVKIVKSLTGQLNEGFRNLKFQAMHVPTESQDFNLFIKQ